MGDTNSGAAANPPRRLLVALVMEVGLGNAPLGEVYQAIYQKSDLSRHKTPINARRIVRRAVENGDLVTAITDPGIDGEVVVHRLKEVLDAPKVSHRPGPAFVVLAAASGRLFRGRRFWYTEHTKGLPCTSSAICRSCASSSSVPEGPLYERASKPEIHLKVPTCRHARLSPPQCPWGVVRVALRRGVGARPDRRLLLHLRRLVRRWSRRVRLPEHRWTVDRRRAVRQSVAAVPAPDAQGILTGAHAFN